MIVPRRPGSIHESDADRGQLSSHSLTTADGNEFHCIAAHKTIKYLGINFNDELKFNASEVIAQLATNLNQLVSSVSLIPDQKLNIINQYIWPQLIYPLQCLPLKDLTAKFLADVDKIIRSSVKEIIGLPMDNPDAMICAPRKLRGLGVFRDQREAFLQHINVCRLLLDENNPNIAATRNLQDEIDLSTYRISPHRGGLELLVFMENFRNVLFFPFTLPKDGITRKVKITVERSYKQIVEITWHSPYGWGKSRKKPNQVISPCGVKPTPQRNFGSAGKRLSRLSYTDDLLVVVVLVFYLTPKRKTQSNSSPWGDVVTYFITLYNPITSTDLKLASSSFNGIMATATPPMTNRQCHGITMN
ncbi:hypothetical protein ANN_07304 [Periplaneta americana]|uniref:Uncharacterized protein n=1 Tax=Periplaneta americana TaxID=6978 RepID=A0ABQ8TFU8_PERAM|nr:hypothetical protein ANN_07304 [Periplaneta americana]